uniref:LRAT domain-containing protein n=1 Tax=Fundulus heteroclitus TaxID=8078 RepID=A0A3Q2QHJ5_FUNHE
AVYIGRGHVVHLVNPFSMGSSGSSVPVPGEMGVVLEQKLEEVVGNDRWRINNYLDKKRKPQQGYAIVKQAIGFIDARLPYSVIKSNCEHFATDLRYEKPTSRQVGQMRCEPSLALIVSMARWNVILFHVLLKCSLNNDDNDDDYDHKKRLHHHPEAGKKRDKKIFHTSLSNSMNYFKLNI